MWDLVIGLLKRGMEEGDFRSDLNPVEVAIILWSSATTLLLRLDSEGEAWKERLNIDLEHVLETSNKLLFESILTDKAYIEFTSLSHK
jgi:hypothetical protein